ncbi:MAG: hypothetical protein ACHQX1_00375 [Candidatus Micrarchaeales archaeon]
MADEISESKLIEREVTLRNLILTKEVTETRRSLIRWLALSLGVINPGESRQAAIAVFDSIMYFQFTEKRDPEVNEMMEYINRAWGDPINEKTLRYHLLQLSKANIVKHSKGKYFLPQADGAKSYDCEAWVNHYFISEINPIKEKLLSAMKELKTR